MERTQHSFGDIARRTALSFFLFSFVLTFLLGLSWYLLIPELTRVTVSGQPRDIVELQEYNNNIQHEIKELEAKRGAFLLPVQNELYQRLKTVKDKRSQFEDLRREIQQVSSELVPDRNDVIVLSQFAYNAATRQAVIRGDVRNVGPRSMTVLARFVENIQNINFVIDVESSKYMRLEDPTLGFYSPFTLRIRLDRV